MPFQLPSILVETMPLVLFLATALASLGLLASFGHVAWSLLQSRGAGAAATTFPSSRLPRTRLSGPWLYRVALVELPVAALWLLVTCVQILGWHVYLIESGPDRPPFITYISSMLVTLLAWQLWWNLTSARRNQVTGFVIQTTQIAGLFWCASLLSLAPSSDRFREMPPGDLVAVQEARTDQGTRIKLYARQVDPSELERFYASSREHIGELARYAMLRTAAVPNINCHGWAFTGQYIVKGEDVPTILKENGYSQVDKPQVNDLAIYRDAQGMVVHTGVVCGFLADTPLVESKWGIAATYVHQVNQQPYSPHFLYYRSARSGHRLQYCEGEGDKDRLALASRPDAFSQGGLATW